MLRLGARNEYFPMPAFDLDEEGRHFSLFTTLRGSVPSRTKHLNDTFHLVFFFILCFYKNPNDHGFNLILLFLYVSRQWLQLTAGHWPLLFYVIPFHPVYEIMEKTHYVVLDEPKGQPKKNIRKKLK